MIHALGMLLDFGKSKNTLACGSSIFTPAQKTIQYSFIHENFKEILDFICKTLSQ
jgi:hypothetical protein